MKNPVFAEALGSWLDRTVEIYADRILPVDTTVARWWGLAFSKASISSSMNSGTALSLNPMRCLRGSLKTPRRCSGLSSLMCERRGSKILNDMRRLDSVCGNKRNRKSPRL